tara:strand:+ start:2625 stop:3083 length:459 start_codon:yes stop_codon:yes gene_type:complete
MATTAKSVQHPHSKLKTQKEYKEITDSDEFKNADYKKKNEMLGSKSWTGEEMGKMHKERRENIHEKSKRGHYKASEDFGGTYKKGGKVKKRKNTSRENRLEELGRVDAEKAFSKKGKRNLKSEKKRIVRELHSHGGSAGAVMSGKKVGIQIK